MLLYFPTALCIGFYSEERIQQNDINLFSYKLLITLKVYLNSVNHCLETTKYYHHISSSDISTKYYDNNQNTPFTNILQFKAYVCTHTNTTAYIVPAQLPVSQ